ncbi:MAG: N-acetylmuramidase family protein [Bacteroidales bacterium]|nr:N-acetylmuramidase family protein [Bacteroidales bacterium]
MRNLPLIVLVAVTASTIYAKSSQDSIPEANGALQLPYLDISSVIDTYLEDIVNPNLWVDTAILHLGYKGESSMQPLTDSDYDAVAKELGVEPAVIKAVVDVETGKRHEGFWQEGKPLINFDLSMYRRFAPRHGVSLSKAQKKAPVIFARPDVKRYGSQQAAQYARFDAACEIDSASALESCFWGMFQIGGFNWKRCGTGSVEEFVRLMSRSERDQLELFTHFIAANNDMVKDLRKKDWLSFALKYNGPKARSRGYHTRLAAAYDRHRKKS